MSCCRLHVAGPSSVHRCLFPVLRESTRRVKTSSSHCCAVSPGPEGMRRMGGRTQQIISILQAPFCLGLKTRWREEPITKSSVVGGEQCPVTPLWSSWRWWGQRELHTMASLMAKTTHSHLSYNDGRSEAAHGSLDWKWALLSHPSCLFFKLSPFLLILFFAFNPFSKRLSQLCLSEIVVCALGCARV